MKRWLKPVLFLLIVIGLGWIAKVLGFDVRQISPERIRQFVESFGVWAPAIYLLAYGQPLLPLPASVMTITGGLAFGPAWGTAAALVGATIRASTQFAVARLLGRDVVAKLLRGKVAALDQRLGENSFKTVLLIRIIPNLPFDVQNYGLGFSQVKFWPYLFASFLGMLPGCFAYVYLGYSLTDPKQIWKLGVAVAIIVGLVFLQKALKARSAAQPPAK